MVNPWSIETSVLHCIASRPDSVEDDEVVRFLTQKSEDLEQDRNEILDGKFVRPGVVERTPAARWYSIRPLQTAFGRSRLTKALT